MSRAPKLTPAEALRKAELALIWRHTHRDYRGTLNGVRNIMVCRGGTCLVNLHDLTEAEIADRVGMARRIEAAKKEAR